MLFNKMSCILVLVSTLIARRGSGSEDASMSPLLPALFCPPSRLPPVPAPCQPLPARAKRSMFVTRGAAEYVSQKEGVQHQNKNHVDLILVFGGQSMLSMYVCTLSYSTFEGKKGFPPNLQYQKVPTEFSSGIGSVNTEKYQPNTNQKYQIGLQL
jgi:hypothetical protein